MIRLFWVLLAAVSLSWFVLDLMMDRPESVTYSQVRAGKTGERQSKPATSFEQMLSSPDDSGKGQAAIKPSFQFPQGPTPEGLPPPSEEGPPEIFTPSGMPVVELEEIDIQAIEDRLLEEQITESFRDPGHFSGVSIGAPGSTDPEEKEETEEVPDTVQVTDAVDEVDEIEEETLELREFYVAEADTFSADEGNAEEHVVMTESGIPIDSETVDYNEVEERILNAQLEESQRNPAYSQTVSEEALNIKHDLTDDSSLQKNK